MDKEEIQEQPEVASKKVKKDVDPLAKYRKAAGLKPSDVFSYNDSYPDKVVFVTKQGQKVTVEKG